VRAKDAWSRRFILFLMGHSVEEKANGFGGDRGSFLDWRWILAFFT
jgi:hypothetical protein